MDLLAEGATEKEAARLLGISHPAAANRLRRARLRFGAETTLHLYALVTAQKVAA